MVIGVTPQEAAISAIVNFRESYIRCALSTRPGVILGLRPPARRGYARRPGLRRSDEGRFVLGRLVFHVFAALAEFIRELIVSGTREGLAAARARGRVGGRPSVITPEILRAARDMLPNPEASVTAIAKLLGVSPGTLYNHIPDLRELRAASRARTQVPAARAATS